MKAQDIRKRTAPNIEKLLATNQEKIRQLRFDLVAGKVKNIKEIRHARRDIARMLTILKEQKKKK